MIPQGSFYYVKDKNVFKKKIGYNGTTRLEHLARCRNGFHYNVKTLLGSLKNKIDRLIDDKDLKKSMFKKIEDLHGELEQDVDKKWLQHRNYVLEEEEDE
jgi:hypothetical protein